MYRIDDEKGAVTEVQRELYARYLRSGKTGPRVPVDGIYGTETEAAIRQYQSDTGLPVTGKTDYRTFDALMNEPDRTPDPAKTLAVGSAGTEVERLHLLLSELSKHFHVFPTVPRAGYYGEDTTECVRHMQRALRMEETGEVTDLFFEELVLELAFRRRLDGKQA